MALTQEWIRQLGTSASAYASALTSDGSGHIYIAGTTQGAMVESEIAGGSDAWIAKFTSDGTEVWRKQLGTAADEFTTALTSDHHGHIYIAGSTTGDMVDGKATDNDNNAWIAKFAANGTELWRKQISTHHTQYAKALTSDIGGHIYIAGMTDNDLVEGQAAGGNDAWIAKFTNDGAEVWRKQLGTAKDDEATALTSDGSGHVYIAGSTHGDLVAGKDPGLYSSDAWIAKFASDGTEVWRKQLGTIKNDAAYALANDGNEHIYVAGYTYGELVAGKDPGLYSSDAWIAKFASDGTEVWRRQLGTAEDDAAYALTSGGSGNVYIAGYTTGELVKGNAVGGGDAWVAKFASDGTEVWRKQLGTPKDDVAYALTSDGSGNIYIAGSTTGDMVAGQTVTDYRDAWLAKFYDAPATVSEADARDRQRYQMLQNQVASLNAKLDAMLSLFSETLP